MARNGFRMKLPFEQQDGSVLHQLLDSAAGMSGLIFPFVLFYQFLDPDPGTLILVLCLPHPDP